MKIKQVLLTLSLLVACVLGSSAEEIDSEKFQKGFEEFARQLELRDDQKEPSSQILLKSAKGQQKVLSRYDIRLGENTPIRLSFPEIRQFGGEMRKVGEQTERELAAVLDSQQMTRYRKLRQEKAKELRKELSSRMR